MTNDCELRVASALRAFALVVVQIAALACSDASAPIVPTKYVVTTNKNTATVGDTIIVKAQLVDANDRPVTHVSNTVSWFFSGGGGGNFTSAQSVTDGLGVASNYFVVGPKADVKNTISVLDENHRTGTSPPITVVAGAPNLYMVRIGTTNPDIGSTITVNAQLSDKFNNELHIANRVVTWSIESGGGGYYYERGVRTNRLVAPTHAQRASTTGGTFSSATSATNAQGLATVDFNVGTTINDTYVIMAKDDQVSGTSPLITVRPGPPTKFVVSVSVTDPPAGSAVVVSAYPTDSYDNRITTPGIPVNWSASGGGTLSSSASSTNQDGTATTTLTTASTPGVTHVVTASGSNLSSGASPAITTIEQVSLSSLASGFGIQSSCGVATDGKVWCWGMQDGGLLPGRPLPGKLIGDQVVSAISNAARHSCAIAGGVVLCWGMDDAGQLGDNSHTNRTTPAPINSSLSFTAVSAGTSHTCAIATTGDIYCWGLAADGRLGDGTGFTGLGPIKVAGGLTFTAVSAGEAHTCAIAASGDAYCWGPGTQGQLGTGAYSGSNVPKLVSGGLKFTAISAGFAHTCGLAGGRVYCWGDNTLGQLGDGLTASTAVPIAIANTSTFSAVAAGGFHACAIASDAKAYCWGDNSSGELGNLNLPVNHSAVPIAVAGSLSFKSIAVGGSGEINDYYYGPYALGHTCGLTTDGVAYCWGSNGLGELGISTFTQPYANPQKVSGQH